MNSPKKPSNKLGDARTPKRKGLAPAGVAAECWCRDSRLVAFGPDYLQCLSCGTLVSQKGLSASELQVVDDEHDFYGRQYWLDHQQQDLDYPGLEIRTRSDLPERNLHWLRALLKYRLPPSQAMELGCAHGSFVALMQQAGYAAFGVEMSPWVVEFGRKTFGIDVRTGPVEALDIGQGSLDVIAMMDVMEHLPDPVATMGYCLSLLKPDGLLLVQMPNFVEGMNYEELVETKSPFLEQLKSDEHLYLYSKRSTIEFFHRLGADHIEFEPAIFAHYDMFFAVSRSPLHTNSAKQIEVSLQTSPSGRIALALLDMKDRYDRVPSLQAEIASNAQLQRELYERADKLKNERNLVEAKLGDLQSNFDAVEVDRAARGEVIEAQGRLISDLQAQIHQRLGELKALYQQIEELRNLPQARLEELASLQDNFAAMEKDRVARGEVIEAQGHAISDLHAEIHRRLGELNAIYPQLEELRSLSQARLEELASLQDNFAAMEKDRAARGEVIEAQGHTISDLHAQIHRRLGELNAIYPQLEELRNLSQARLEELASLQDNFAAIEKDRIARGEVIEAQGNTISDLQAQVHQRLEELHGAYLRLDESARVLHDVRCTLAERDALVESSQQQQALHERAVEEATVELRRLQAVLAESVSEVGNLRNLIAEREQSWQEDMRRREAVMHALHKRVWWKLGKLIKAL